MAPITGKVQQATMFGLIDKENLTDLNATLGNLTGTVNTLVSAIKQLKETSETFKKSSSDPFAANAEGNQYYGSGGSGATGGMTKSEAAQYAYVRNMSIMDTINNFTSAISSAITTILNLASKAAQYESSLTNLSYRMTNPTGQMNDMYSRDGLMAVTTALNNETDKPWRKIQLEEMVGVTEKFLQYGKYNNQTEGTQGLRNISEMGRIGGESYIRRGLDINSGVESAMKYNVAGVELKDLRKFTEQLGDVAKIGSMTSREVLAIDSAIRKLSMSAGRGSDQIQKFGVEYMKTAGVISLVGGNPLDITNKMNQWAMGSQSGMIDALMLKYNPNTPYQNLMNTSQAAQSMQSMLSSMPATMQPFMFEQMKGSMGLSAFEYSDLEPLARTGKGKAKQTSERILADIAKNTEQYAAKADDFAAGMSQLNMSIIKVGQGQLKGISSVMKSIGPPILKGLGGIANFLKEHNALTTTLITISSTFFAGVGAYIAFRMFKDYGGKLGDTMEEALRKANGWDKVKPDRWWNKKVSLQGAKDLAGKAWQGTKGLAVKAGRGIVNTTKSGFAKASAVGALLGVATVQALDYFGLRTGDEIGAADLSWENLANLVPRLRKDLLLAEKEKKAAELKNNPELAQRQQDKITKLNRMINQIEKDLKNYSKADLTKMVNGVVETDRNDVNEGSWHNAIGEYSAPFVGGGGNGVTTSGYSASLRPQNILINAKAAQAARADYVTRTTPKLNDIDDLYRPENFQFESQDDLDSFGSLAQNRERRRKLEDIFKRHGITYDASENKEHAIGSKHPLGGAIDSQNNANYSDAQFIALAKEIESKGEIARFETIRQKESLPEELQKYYQAPGKGFVGNSHLHAELSHLLGDDYAGRRSVSASDATKEEQANLSKGNWYDAVRAITTKNKEIKTPEVVVGKDGVTRVVDGSKKTVEKTGALAAVASGVTSKEAKTEAVASKAGSPYGDIIDKATSGPQLAGLAKGVQQPTSVAAILASAPSASQLEKAEDTQTLPVRDEELIGLTQQILALMQGSSNKIAPAQIPGSTRVAAGEKTYGETPSTSNAPRRWRTMAFAG